MSSVAFQLSDDDIGRIAAAVAQQLAKQPAAELLTPAQVAARTGLTLKSLERRRSRNQAPLSVRRQGRVFYTAAEVEKYVRGAA